MNTLRLIVLFVILMTAMWSDVRLRKIPNRLVVVTALLGFAFSAMADGIGVAQAAGGLALGFVFLIPLHALRAMGAGDVKLMAALGTFLGVNGTVVAVLATFLAGGLLSIAYALHTGTLRQTGQNLRFLVWHCAVRLAGGTVPRMEEFPVSGARLPYSIAIACGVASWFAGRYYYTGALE